MGDFWVAYAAVVATIAVLLEFRRFVESRRPRVNVDIGTEEGTLDRSIAFAVTVVNRSAFAIHVIRSGINWGVPETGLESISVQSPLIGEVGPLGARRVDLIRIDTWTRALHNAAAWKQDPSEYARAWIELSTGERFFSREFKCELKETGASLLARLPTPPLWIRVVNKAVPARVRSWLESKQRQRRLKHPRYW